MHWSNHTYAHKNIIENVPRPQFSLTKYLHCMSDCAQNDLNITCIWAVTFLSAN